MTEKMSQKSASWDKHDMGLEDILHFLRRNQATTGRNIIFPLVRVRSCYVKIYPTPV